jgi:hypothetical protein
MTDRGISCELQEDFESFFNSLLELFYLFKEQESFTRDDIEFGQEKVRGAINTLSFIKSHPSFQNQASPDLHQSIEGLLNYFIYARRILQDIHAPQSQCSVPAIVNGAGEVLLTGQVGRPQAYVNVEQVLYLLNHGFTYTEVPKIFLIHRTTLWRRLRNEVDFSTIHGNWE